MKKRNDPPSLHSRDPAAGFTDKYNNLKCKTFYTSEMTQDAMVKNPAVGQAPASGRDFLTSQAWVLPAKGVYKQCLSLYQADFQGCSACPFPGDRWTPGVFSAVSQAVWGSPYRGASHQPPRLEILAESCCRFSLPWTLCRSAMSGRADALPLAVLFWQFLKKL